MNMRSKARRQVAPCLKLLVAYLICIYSFAEGGPGYAEHSGGFHLVSSAFFELRRIISFSTTSSKLFEKFPGMGIGDVIAFFGGNGTRSVWDCGIAFFGGLNAESGGGRSIALEVPVRLSEQWFGLGFGRRRFELPDDSLESMRLVKVLGKSLQRMRFPFDTTEDE